MLIDARARGVLWASHALPTFHYAADPPPDKGALSPASTGTSTTTRPPALLTLGTLSATDRLTQKFPVSTTVRGLSAEGAKAWAGSAASLGSALAQGKGLGRERIDRWTRHKWCLFLSVCTLFFSGTLGLVCVVFTWFKSECVSVVCPM